MFSSHRQQRRDFYKLFIFGNESSWEIFLIFFIFGDFSPKKKTLPVLDQHFLQRENAHYRKSLSKNVSTLFLSSRV